MTTLDSTLERTEGTPNPEGSVKEVEQGSGTVTITKADWDKFSSRLEKLERDDQSNKDRAVKRTNERLGDLESKVSPLLERVAELAKSGVSPQQAIAQAQNERDEAVLKERMRDFFLNEKPNPLADEGVDVGNVISEYGLDMDNPEVKSAFAGKQFKSDVEVKAVVADLMKPKPTPTPAQSPSAVAKPIQENDMDKLQKLYQAEIQSAGRGNILRISQIQAEYRKKGLPV